MPLDRPQRITHPAAPGALLKRLDGLHRLAQPHANDGERDEEHLRLLRQLPCLYCGLEPAGEAAHVRMSSAAHHKASGLGKTPPDRWALPLCGEHHRVTRDAQHNKGERQFWYELGIPALTVCENLYAARGDLMAMRAVVMVAIAERGR